MQLHKLVSNVTESQTVVTSFFAYFTGLFRVKFLFGSLLYSYVFLCIFFSLCVCMINSLYSCLFPYFHVFTLYCSFLFLLRSCFFVLFLLLSVFVFLSVCLVCCLIRSNFRFFLSSVSFFLVLFHFCQFLSPVTIVTKSFLKGNIYLSLSHIFIS